MKVKKIFILVVIFVFVSCVSDEDTPKEGFTVRFTNHTNSDYNNSKLFIGGIQNNTFIVTDSIEIIPKIKLNDNTFRFIGNNRWKPDLAKIKNIPSEKIYFYIRLNENREGLLGVYNQVLPFSIELPANNLIEGNRGMLYVYIYNDRITADIGK